MALPPFVASVITWLRAGYPEGVPEVDYVPLFALLASQLTEDDVRAVVIEMEKESDPQSAQAIKDAIAKYTHDKPLESDVARVRARLAGAGWPLARPAS